MNWPDDYINKIICGDCLEVMKGIPDKAVDLVLTSPPYDNLRAYNKYEFIFKLIAGQIYRVIKDGGLCVWVVGDQTNNGSESGTSFEQALYFKELGFNIHDTMIYKKQNYAPLNHNRFEQEFEYMFVFSKGKPKTFNPIKIKCTYGGEYRNSNFSEHGEKMKRVRSNAKRNTIGDMKIKGNIWEYKVGQGHSTQDEIAFKHPAIFPDNLAYDHVLSWSNKGDIVLDPFSGSGTTCKMAKAAGRKYIGIDISDKYCEIAQCRLAQEYLFT